MGIERFIAGRYLRSKRQMRFINIIMLVSVVGITVGVAVLVIVLSVFNGFNTVVTNVLVGFDPHLRVEPVRGKGFVPSDSLEKMLADDPRIAGVSPFIESKALLISQQQNRVTFVKGVVDSTVDRVSGVKRSIVLGRFAFDDASGLPGIVIGMTLADRLGATEGAEITVVSPVGADAMMMQFGQPLARKCRVAGIFDSNNKDYDLHYAFIAIGVARQLFQFEDQISGIDIRLRDIDDTERMKQHVQEEFGPSYAVSSWYDLHRDLYSVMKIERWGAFIIVCLIVAVASFNVLGSLSMGVMEKRRDIGVLRAMGATRASITRVFMFEGILVGVAGTIAGLLIGVTVCMLQSEFLIFRLDPTVYIIPALPVEIRWSDILLVACASMLLSTVVSLYPARRAAQQLPVDAIRWE